MDTQGVRMNILTHLNSKEENFQKEEVDVYSPHSSSKYGEKFWESHREQIKADSERKKKPNQLESLRVKEPHSGEFPGVSFCLIRPRIGETNHSETPAGIDGKITKKRRVKGDQGR